MIIARIFFAALFAALVPAARAFPQEKGSDASDARVQAFLDDRARTWRDLNISDADGKILYDIIVSRGYTRALEIGTSTGRSETWIAWALSKTGGKLITVEIDERRRAQALENFRKAGLEGYVDSRLGNAHDIVPALEGPFDFVFSDADKEWYENYLLAVEPKLVVGGCFTAHNVRNLSRTPGIREFLARVRSMPNMETTLDTSTSSGISISYKTGPSPNTEK